MWQTFNEIPDSDFRKKADFHLAFELEKQNVAGFDKTEDTNNGLRKTNKRASWK